MQDFRDAGKEGCREGGMQERKGAGKEGCKKGGCRKGGCRKGRMQARRDSRGEGCRKEFHFVLSLFCTTVINRTLFLMLNF